jgi:catechol 2,3-dioxygenase-like lactoylglutathione lyase family enzyme
MNPNAFHSESPVSGIKVSNNSITHIGLIVRDIEATRRHYVEIMGAAEAPIGITDTPDIAKTTYAGQPSSVRAKICHLRLGSIQVELIQPLGGGPSTWQDFLDKHGEGVHHIAIETPDAVADMKRLADAGAGPVQYGEWVGGNYNYADTTRQLGVMVELIKND